MSTTRFPNLSVPYDGEANGSCFLEGRRKDKTEISVYLLQMSPSSSPSVQSLMKSHACLSLITVPFQQLKKPSRTILEAGRDPRKKENTDKFRVPHHLCPQTPGCKTSCDSNHMVTECWKTEIRTQFDHLMSKCKVAPLRVCGHDKH